MQRKSNREKYRNAEMDTWSISYTSMRQKLHICAPEPKYLYTPDSHKPDVGVYAKYTKARVHKDVTKKNWKKAKIGQFKQKEEIKTKKEREI